MKNQRTLSLAQMALMGAVIFILAFTPGIGYIPLGVTRATIVHIPVIVGAVLLGPAKGAFLGFLFGITSLIVNTATPTITSFTFSPFYNGGNLWSLVVCFVPRILIGVAAYYVYAGLKKLGEKIENRPGRKAETFLSKLLGSSTFQLAAAGAAGSMTNTILVMNLIYFCFGDAYAGAKDMLPDALYGFIMSVIAVNGIPEAVLAGVLTAAVAGALLRYTRRHPAKTA